MTIGRTFPLPAPTRVFPLDPVIHGQTERDAPIPFQVGAGALTTITTLYTAGWILQRTITTVTPGGGGGGGGGGLVTVNCSPASNLYCVPQATVSKAISPTATVRCAQ